MKFVLGLILLFTCAPSLANDVVVPVRNLNEKQAYIAELKQIIAEIDADLIKCKRAQRNWKTATAIGAVGTVATGTAAIIQGIQIKKLKNAEKQANQAENADEE